jgi:hypothetical protein
MWGGRYLKVALEEYRRLSKSQTAHLNHQEELTSTDWAFRFKAQAGPEWQLHDPYWTNGQVFIHYYYSK